MVTLARRPAGRERQHAGDAVEGFDRRLLVNAEYDRALGRDDVDRDDVGCSSPTRS